MKRALAPATDIDELRARLDSDPFVRAQDEAEGARKRDAVFYKWARSKLYAVELTAPTVLWMASVGIGV